MSSNVYAIEYFDITNPRFQPLLVGVTIEPASDVDALFIQSMFQNNLEQTMYFKVKRLTGKNAEVLSSGSKEYTFHLSLKLSPGPPLRMDYSLRHLESGEELLHAQFSGGTSGKLRPWAIKLANDIVKATMGFDGVADSQIAYTYAMPKGRKVISLTSFDGTQNKRFSYNLGINNLPSWSFDNLSILYTSFSNSISQVSLQSLDRLKARILSFPGVQPLGGSWSPDGTQILLTLMKHGNADIYLYPLDGSKEPEPLTSWKSLETAPAWSPDGKKMAFVSDRIRYKQPQIYIYYFKTKKSERVTFKGRYNTSPKWSPDSKWLVYEGLIDGYFQIFKYYLPSQRHQQLTFGNYDSEKPDWSPNGQTLVFSSRKAGIPKLYYMSVHGGNSVRVTTNPNKISETAPAWSKQPPTLKNLKEQEVDENENKE
ncbi:hypothetical protein WDW89_12740 [Deltaproteobacteria bacterium TL4]